MRKAKENFSNIIGYEDVKKELNVVLNMLQEPDKYEKLGAKQIRGILLHGQPGTGKTTLANDFIKASGLTCYNIRKNKADGAFIDAIVDTFRRASREYNTKQTRSIIFLDDMDKYANGDDIRRNCEEYVAIQSCIDNLDEQEILVVATANEIRNLPDSLLRVGRFDKIIEIENPSTKDAAKIVKHYLSKKKNIDDVDHEEVAQILSGGSCAQLESVINEAAIIAAYNNEDLIKMEHIVKAAMRVIYNAPEETDNREDKYLINVAYHEAGHAIIGELLEPGSVNLVSVAKYACNVNGVTKYDQSNDYFKSIDFMENRVMSLLAGKAANEIAFGFYDVGCNNDLHRAYDIVTRFVDDYCTQGFNTWEGITMDSSDDLKNRKEAIVSYEMQQYYNKVKKMLIDNRKFLDALANNLVKNTTLTKKDIINIKSNLNNPTV